MKQNFLTKHTYSFGLLKIFFTVMLTTSTVWITSILLGNKYDESASSSPSVSKTDDSIEIFLVAALISSFLFVLLIKYLRLVHSVKFLNLSKKAYIAMVAIQVVIYVWMVVMFASLLFIPFPETGFEILVIPALFINALWFLPLIGFVADKLFKILFTNKH